MKSLKYLAMFAVVLACATFAVDALAAGGQSDSVFQKAVNTMANIFSNVRVVIYVLGAFGLIGIAVGGIMGAIKWKWLGALAMGLGIIAVADYVVTYATEGMYEDSGVASFDGFDDGSSSGY